MNGNDRSWSLTSQFKFRVNGSTVSTLLVSVTEIGLQASSFPRWLRWETQPSTSSLRTLTFSQRWLETILTRSVRKNTHNIAGWYLVNIYKRYCRYAFYSFRWSAEAVWEKLFSTFVFSWELLWVHIWETFRWEWDIIFLFLDSHAFGQKAAKVLPAAPEWYLLVRGVLRGERAAHGRRGRGPQHRQVAPWHRLGLSQAMLRKLLHLRWSEGFKTWQ